MCLYTSTNECAYKVAHMLVKNAKFICDHVFWWRDPPDIVVPFLTSDLLES